MRLLLLPKYGRRAASSRLRYFQYVPYLESQGIVCTVSPLFEDEYVARRSRSRGGAAKAAGLLGLAQAFVRRAQAIRSARGFDLILMHCEAFPYLPPILERQLQRLGVPYAVDYDDAIFHNYDLHRRAIVRRVLGGKIASVLRGASAVIAGSEYLAEYARRVNDQVHVLPTVIDTERYGLSARPVSVGNEFRIGWIGSFSTMPYLRLIEEALAGYCREGKARLTVVGAGKMDLSVSPVEFREWSEATEVNDCRAFDVGIMPLPDTPWARGKCGYKLIQYMGCGLPVIASPVGANNDIVRSGENGFLAKTTAEWQEALETLRKDPVLARTMGETGRRLVEERYSLRATAPELKRILETCGKTTSAARVPL
ncbi:MAG: glycosyltransferase family 4 protein [Capsulimonadales bacterium]|nr:glycosyltransferase family 4 protein [Capsulimonadales bacterium]